MSNKSCYDQTVKMVESLSNVLSIDVPRIISFAENDKYAFTNTMKDFKSGLMTSISNASNKIATGEISKLDVENIKISIPLIGNLRVITDT